MSNQTAQLFTETGAKLFTSGQVAGQLGIARNSLMMFLSRHPQLHPARRIGQDLFWSEGEVTALAQAKATAKPGRPSK